MTEPGFLKELLGHDVSLDYHLRSPDRAAGLLDEAGLTTSPHGARTA